MIDTKRSRTVGNEDLNPPARPCSLTRLMCLPELLLYLYDLRAITLRRQPCSLAYKLDISDVSLLSSLLLESIYTSYLMDNTHMYALGHLSTLLAAIYLVFVCIITCICTKLEIRRGIR